MSKKEIDIYPVLYTEKDIHSKSIVVEMLTIRSDEFISEDSYPEWWDAVFVFKDIFELSETCLLILDYHIHEGWVRCDNFLTERVDVDLPNTVNLNEDQQLEKWREWFSSRMNELQMEWDQTGIFPANEIADRIASLDCHTRISFVGLMEDYVKKVWHKAVLLYGLVASNPQNAEHVRFDPNLDSKMIAEAINGVNSSVWIGTFDLFEENW